MLGVDYQLGLEIVALRQQLTVLKRRTKRARLRHSTECSGSRCADFGRTGLNRF
jgi:hypothetical protein